MSADLTISRLIKAPPAAVWQAWSDPHHFAQWWIPEPYECKVIKLDLRPGGGFETMMREGVLAKNGEEFQPHVEGCFLEIEPERKLTFTTSLIEDWRPGDPWLALTAQITFTPEDGGTRYTARVLHKTEAEARKHDEMGFYEGWGTALAQLARLLEK
ncbi:SRPBCC family protein [Novosphingobium sp. PS1R-30]|uniref:SRPBCC family protein n=1 Tax=Novosphingobium anseongense TaxID=3133436 RepID=A0ABU8S2B4_9SPHN